MNVVIRPLHVLTIPLVSPFTISGPSAFDLRDFGDAIHCVGHSCLEAVSAMERRLLVGGDPCADHRQGQGVTDRLKSLSVHPLFDIAFSVSARAAAAGPFDFAASSGLKQLLCVADCPDAAVTVFSHMPVRILSCACSAVAALSARHITAGITVVFSKII